VEGRGEGGGGLSGGGDPDVRGEAGGELSDPDRDNGRDGGVVGRGGGLLPPTVFARVKTFSDAADDIDVVERREPVLRGDMP